ncbi:MAG: hypothetical protein JW891_11255, partial [Candidatus Lokiarchaeota archaeon]|nr:hypothetical protein [Candidatus Lokiarchaeota archaeon]
YIVDDGKVLYSWMGKSVSDKKKKLCQDKIEQIKKSKKGEVKIFSMIQGKEYGTFLALMDVLRNGIPNNAEIERRNELKLKVDETKELIEAGLEPDLEAEITLKAHEIEMEGWSYEELCHILAESQLEQISTKKPTKNEIQNKINEILKSTSTYQEICWLIAQLDLIKKAD